MNDDRLGPAAGQWLRDIDVPPADPDSAVQHAMEQVQRTGQVRHWWPFPALQRKQKAAITTTDTTPLLPSPIPATNGHTATVTWRTRNMFSPVKAIIAGALVFGIGSAVLIAQQSGQRGGPVPGAETDAAPQPPTEYTRREAVCSSGGPEVRRRNTETLEVGDSMALKRDRDGAWKWAIESASDPRMAGTVYHTYESDSYVPGPAIDVWTERIVNADGAWLDVGVKVRSPEGSFLGDSGPQVWLGEGAYEGLVAVDMESTEIEDCISEYRGIIFDGAPGFDGYQPK